MKKRHIKTFEQYDSPDVPKISDEEIKDMTNIRLNYNKVQQGFYHKGSADINTEIFNKGDQEKYDIMTIFHNVSKKYFNDFEILETNPSFNWLRGETAHLNNSLTKEIETENYGNVQINIEYTLYHNYTGEIHDKELKVFDEYENTNNIFLSCSTKSYYDKAKEDRKLLNTVFSGNKNNKIKKSSLATFRVDKVQDYTEEEMIIQDKERKFNDNFIYNEKNIKSANMEQEIKRCGTIYNKFLNYLDAKYDITINDLK